MNYYSDYSVLSKELVNIILYNKWADPLGEAEFSPNYYFGNKTLFTSKNELNKGYIRGIYDIRKGNISKKGIFTSPYLSSLQSSVFLKSEAFPDEEVVYIVELNASYEKSVAFVLYLDIYSNGEKIEDLTQKIDDIKIRNVWSSSYRFSGHLSPGDYLFIIRDQFGTIHAKGHLHIKDLSIKLKEIKDNFYSFEVLLDGEKINNQKVKLRINEGGEIERVISNGELTLLAKLPKGRHKMTVEFKDEGRIEEIYFENYATTPLDIYLIYFPIGLVIVLIVFIIFKSKPKHKYSLSIPDLSEELAKETYMSKKKFLSIFNDIEKEFNWNKIPLKFNEIKYGIKNYAAEGREIIIVDSNLINILTEFKEEGDILEYNGYYLLSSWAKSKEEVKEKVLYRMIRDRLISEGVEFDENRTFKLKRNKIEISPSKDIKKMKIIKKNYKKVVVFLDKKELDEFRKSLSSLEKDKIKISILIDNRALFLTTIKDIGDYL